MPYQMTALLSFPFLSCDIAVKLVISESISIWYSYTAVYIRNIYTCIIEKQTSTLVQSTWKKRRTGRGRRNGTSQTISFDRHCTVQYTALSCTIFVNIKWENCLCLNTRHVHRNSDTPYSSRIRLVFFLNCQFFVENTARIRACYLKIFHVYEGSTRLLASHKRLSGVCVKIWSIAASLWLVIFVIASFL